MKASTLQVTIIEPYIPKNCPLESTSPKISFVKLNKLKCTTIETTISHSRLEEVIPIEHGACKASVVRVTVTKILVTEVPFFSIHIGIAKKFIILFSSLKFLTFSHVLTPHSKEAIKSEFQSLDKTMAVKPTAVAISPVIPMIALTSLC